MKRILMMYAGRVQGVGFRYTLLKLAEPLKLTGYIQNTDNGNVLVLLQGEKEKVDKFIYDSLHIDDYFIRIDDYMVKEIPLVENEEGIKVF